MEKILLIFFIILIVFITSNYIFEHFNIELSPTTGDEPNYEPEKWNSNEYIRKSHNCYSYVLNDIAPSLKEFCKNSKCSAINPQPGHYSGYTKKVNKNDTSCKSLIKRVLIDNPNIYITGFENKCADNYYKGALTVEPNNSYHFYRQDKNGYWSGKDGGGKATNLDASSNLIKDPQKADRTYNHSDFSEFCNYFCIPKNSYLDTKTARRWGGKRLYKNP